MEHQFTLSTAEFASLNMVKAQSVRCCSSWSCSLIFINWRVLMNYIQRKDARYLETVDEFETEKEAKEMLKEYQLSDSSAEYYISTKACKEWKEKK